jgi:hypothetical protein
MKRPDHPDIRKAVAALAIVTLVAACGDRSPSAAPLSSLGPFPVISPAQASSVSSPLPSSGRVLAIDALPSVSLDPAAQTAICDPQAYQLDTDAGEATIACPDGLVLGLRALSTISSSPIERLYLQRPSCDTTPCTEGELSTATVTGWTATDANSVGLDSRKPTVEVMTPASPAVWPSGSSTTPARDRPVIEGAPAEIASRTAYPYCGEAELGDPEAVTECFRDAVLGGRPAELIERYVGTEEGLITRLYRFDGRGALVMYQRSDGRWFRQAGSMILGFTPGAFDFDPLPTTE